jgi:hypothetical protein
MEGFLGNLLRMGMGVHRPRIICEYYKWYYEWEVGMAILMTICLALDYPIVSLLLIPNISARN